MAQRNETIKITIDSDNALRAFDALEARAKEVGKRLKEVNKELNDDSISDQRRGQLVRERKELMQMQKEYNAVLQNTVREYKNIESVLSNISGATYNELIRAQRQLNKEIKSAKPNTDEYIKMQEQLRLINERVEELKDGWKQQENQLVATMKRLAAYVAVYGSFNFVLGKLKELAKGWLELSDTLADVEKTTGLANKQLVMLSRDIDAIDTRTTQQEMHELAATAGQLGMSSREDVLGFVTAANQLTVALNELGRDGVESLAKVATLTGDIQRMGTEKALLAVGSSINQLSAESAASAGPIADFIRRVGGLAPLAKLTTADLAALGATADALGQPIEVASTAMNKFITTLITKTEDISYALNLDVDMMKNLIDSGDAMTAIIKVLEAVRVRGDEGALAGIFKELGSEGARMTQVFSTLANNTGFLKEQVAISKEAFEEATSATDEYNVKNETAAAIVERIGNTIREYFVNADYATGITGFLNKLLDLAKALTGTSNEAVALQSAVKALFLAFVIYSPVKGIVAMARALGTATAASNTLRGAWMKLSTAIKTNIIGLALTAVAAAVTGIVVAAKNWNKESKRLAAAIADLQQQEEGEKQRLQELTEEIKKTKEGTLERAEAIEQFNRKYGEYLGYNLSEKATVEELTSAYELLNRELELRYAKMIETETLKGPLEEYASEVTKIRRKLVDGFESLSARMGIDQKTLVSAVSEVAKAYAKEGKKLSATTSVFFARALGNISGLEGANAQHLQALVNNNIGNIKDLIEAERELLDAREYAAEKGGVAVTSAEENVAKARANAMKVMKDQVSQAATDTQALEEMNEKEMESLIEKGNSVLAYLKQQGSSEADAFQAQLDVIRKVYAGDAWGKALNLPGLKDAYGNLQNLNTASVDNLVTMYKELEDAGQKYTNVDFFNEIFGEKKRVKTIDEMHAFFKDYARQIKDRLKELGYTTAGNFDWSGDKGGDWKNKIKKEFEAAKSALLAYYKERETIIKQAYLDEEITAAEMNRRIAANEQEKSRALVDFYSVMLGEAKKYGIEIEKILEGKDLQKLAQFLTKLGPAMVDGMKLGREQSEGAIRDEAIKMREIIENALLEGDIFGKLENDFRSMLDELSLLTIEFGKNFIAVDDATAEKLISQLTRVADRAYTLTKQDLLVDSKGDESLTAFWTGVTDDQQKLIFEKLRGYYDSVLDMQKRYADRVRREWEQMYKQTGQQALYEANKQLIESGNVEPEGYKKGAGNYNRERGTIKAKATLEGARIQDEIAAYEKRLETLTEGSNEYISVQALIAQRTSELNAIIQQSEIDTTLLTIEQWQKRGEAAGEWAELIGESFTEVAILQKRANKARLDGDEETAKQLEAQAEESRQNSIKAALNKAIDMAKVWSMELGLKIMYNTLAKKSDEQTAAAGANATLKESLASIIAQGFKAAGKEVGSKGIAGLITGAAVIAAAAGLAAAAKTAVANMFPEAAEGVNGTSASAPKRKLTTGMLTYANGKYPVLGNDGVVYDAEYAGAGMATGVYKGAHVGIFSERQPEAVIDGKTTQRLVVDYPWLWNSILTLSKSGHLGYRTFADGNMGSVAGMQPVAQQAQMEAMQQTLAATAAAVAALTERLKQPIGAEVNYFGKGGIQQSTKRGGKWAARNRVGG